jgi:peptidoglycan-associated lipoprotein
MGIQNMSSSHRKAGAVALALAMLFAAEGCKKKAPPAAPPPPKPVEQPKPAAAKPAISRFEAEPSTVERGQASTLSWAVAGDPTDITISPGIGTVAATGTRQVFPSNTTTYTLNARGAGGSDSRTVTVNVTQPAPQAPPPEPPKATVSISDRLGREVQDVYFDYDKYDVREDARAVLTRDADALKSILNDFPGQVVVIEGHADERGSDEYNVALGDRRARAAMDFLTQLGVPGDRLEVISYGKNKPQCTESNEDCWQRNRRAHFVAK